MKWYGCTSFTIFMAASCIMHCGLKIGNVHARFLCTSGYETALIWARGSSGYIYSCLYFTTALFFVLAIVSGNSGPEVSKYSLDFPFLLQGFQNNDCMLATLNKTNLIAYDVLKIGDQLASILYCGLSPAFSITGHHSRFQA